MGEGDFRYKILSISYLVELQDEITVGTLNSICESTHKFWGGVNGRKEEYRKGDGRKRIGCRGEGRKERGRTREKEVVKGRRRDHK